MSKSKKISFSKVITFIFITAVICLSISMADLFSNLITVGGFSFTNNNLTISKYNLYAISMASTDNSSIAEQKAETIILQGGAGFIYLDNSKYYILASLYENESDAKKVQESLKTSNKTSEIITISILPISISNNLSAEEKAILEDSINVFKHTYKKLYDISVSLDTSVINEVNARLSINEIGSEINKISTNFTTLFNEETCNSFMLIKLNLSELMQHINNLISFSNSTPLTSQIKDTYIKIIITYKNLAKSLNMQ